MVGRRYSLVHRPGLYLINDTKDPNARGELFQVGERSQALRRYRQLEAHSVRGALPHRSGRGVPARRRNVAARSWVAARMVPERRGHTLVPILGVVSLLAVVATMLIAVDSFHPDAADPAFSLGVGEVAAPTGVAGSGDPPRTEFQTQVDEVSPSRVPDHVGQRDEAGRGDGSVASDSGSPTGSSGAGSDSSTVQAAGSGGSGSDTSGSGSGGSGGSGSGDQGGGGSSDDSGSGPGGAGPGGGSTGGGGGGGSGGGGGGGGG